jgi:hypothetical protein
MDEKTTKLLNKTFMLAAILVVGILIFFVGQMAYQVRLLDQQNTNQITVSGQGKVYAKPDVALVSLGVTAQASTVASVTKSGTDKMNAVIEAIKNLKIDEKDIQTTNYSLTPVYENYSTPVPMMYPIGGSGGSVGGTIIRNGTTVTGYRLEQNVQVKIRDFTKIGDILSQATSKGANLVGDLQFTIDNPEQYKEQARAEAIKKAKASAKNLAKESGIGLGKIINIYENYSPYPVAYSSIKGMGGAAPDMASIPVIQPGQQEIDVTINLTYQVR